MIGPLLDRVQRGRRAALALTFAVRAVLAVVMAFQYHTWLLYPAALGTLVLSKSFVVLKAAVTPRVLPEAITLVTTNSRLTTFGLAAGGVFGGLAAGVAWLWGSEGALVFTALLAVAGTVLCLRIPKWVESTAGEVPAALRSHPAGRGARRWAAASWSRCGATARSACSPASSRCSSRSSSSRPTPSPPSSCSSSGSSARPPGSASFAGNAAGVAASGRSPSVVVLWCVGAAVAVAAVAAALPGIATAAAVGLVGAAASALAKVSLDAVIQRDLPEESRASAFGRSETVLQLAWVFGRRAGRAAAARHVLDRVHGRGRASSRWSGCRPCCCTTAAASRPFLAVKDRPVAPTRARDRGGHVGWRRCAAVVAPRRAVAALLAPGAASGTPPEVTFAAGAASVVAKPTQYCDLKLQTVRATRTPPSGSPCPRARR